MITMTYDEIIEQYNKIIQRSLKLIYIVRDNNLQKDMINELQTFNSIIRGVKKQSIEMNDERRANSFFHIQCMVNSIISVLKMFLELKRRKYQKAWDLLMDAQEYTSYAMRVNDNSNGVESIVDHLKKIEEVLFPGFPIYNSMGFIMRGGVCSICGEKLEICPHIEEKIYMGRVCKRIHIEDAVIDHFAIVENPMDRRCIPVEFEFEPGKVYDYITLKYLRNTSDSEKRTGTYMKAAAYNFSSLDLF